MDFIKWLFEIASYILCEYILVIKICRFGEVINYYVVKTITINSFTMKEIL